jgi:hypothetical protein
MNGCNARSIAWGLAFLLALSACDSATQEHKTAAAKPKIIDCRGNAATERPSSIVLACGDGGIVLEATWRKWTDSEAEATGSLKINECKPDCANGSHQSIPATLQASHPTSGASPLFTSLALMVHQDGKPVTVTCPLARPSGAGDFIGGCVVPLSQALHLKGPAY